MQEVAGIKIILRCEYISSPPPGSFLAYDSGFERVPRYYIQRISGGSFWRKFVCVCDDCLESQCTEQRVPCHQADEMWGKTKQKSMESSCIGVIYWGIGEIKRPSPICVATFLERLLATWWCHPNYIQSFGVWLLCKFIVHYADVHFIIYSRSTTVSIHIYIYIHA